MEFSNFLSNKRVIIVGPSSSLVNKGMGKFIDSFDVVCRIKKSFPVPKEYENDFSVELKDKIEEKKNKYIFNIDIIKNKLKAKLEKEFGNSQPQQLQQGGKRKTKKSKRKRTRKSKTNKRRSNRRK